MRRFTSDHVPATVKRTVHRPESVGKGASGRWFLLEAHDFTVDATFPAGTIVSVDCPSWTDVHGALAVVMPLVDGEFTGELSELLDREVQMLGGPCRGAVMSFPITELTGLTNVVG